MGWVRISDDFYDHPRFAQLPAPAGDLWIRSIAYANRNLTDGVIPSRAAVGLIDTTGLGLYSGNYASRDYEPSDAIEALLEAGIWHGYGHECPVCPPVGTREYYIHNYLQYQPSRAEVESQRGRVRGRVDKHRRMQRKRAAVDAPAPTPTPIDNDERPSIQGNNANAVAADNGEHPSIQGQPANAVASIDGGTVVGARPSIQGSPANTDDGTNFGERPSIQGNNANAGGGNGGGNGHRNGGCNAVTAALVRPPPIPIPTTKTLSVTDTLVTVSARSRTDDDDAPPSAALSALGVTDPRRVKAEIELRTSRTIDAATATRIVLGILDRGGGPGRIRNVQGYVLSSVRQSWAEIQREIDIGGT